MDEPVAVYEDVLTSTVFCYVCVLFLQLKIIIIIVVIIVILLVMIPVWSGTCQLRHDGNTVPVSLTQLHV